jgi:hypothetical protein
MLIEIKTAKGKLTKAQKACKLPQRLVRNIKDVQDSVDTLMEWNRVLAVGLLAQLKDSYPDNRVRWAKS